MNLRVMIDDREDWLELFKRLREAGLLKKVSDEDIDIPDDLFPMEFFIELDPILSLIENPIVKPFKGKIDGTLTKCVEDAIM